MMKTMAAAALAALLCAAEARRGGVIGPYLVNPCTTNATFKSAVFCDVTKGIDERAADIVKRLGILEKIDALGTGTGPLPSVGLPAYNWWSEATHGISHVRDGPGSSTPEETNFALPITTGGSFNRTMWAATGHAIGVEARAFMNAGNAYSTYWAPVINLVRDPRWGRNIETPGEDPYLSGQYAINFVKGFQEHPEAPGEVMASACCKHYVANSMDGSTVDGHTATRVDFDAVISEQDLVDSYLAPFQACVEEGEVTSLMCSYNSVNGKPSCANPWLLQTVARDQWQFDGYITSDCDADANVFSTHHYTATPEEAVADVLHAGTDVDCGGFVQTHGASALAKKLITEDDIDTRLQYLFRMRLRLGHFDPDGPLQMIPKEAICTPETIELARDGTRQGAVMIKNLDKTLPLKAGGSVAVIGPNQNLSQAIGTYYGGRSPCKGQAGAGQWYNAVDAIKEHASTVKAVMGVPSVTSDDMSGIPAAVAAAKDADEVVLVVGQDGTIEHEGHDRVSIALSPAQSALIKAVSAAAKKPVVVLILTGGAVDVADMLENDKVGAIIHAGQPSVTVSGAGDLIFGKAVPAGRMIQQILPASFADEVSIFDFGMRPGPGLWPAPNCSSDPESSQGCKNATNPGRTHRFYTGKPTIPFGFGLSFTTFDYKIVSAPSAVSLAPVRDMLQANADRAIPKAEENAPHAQYVVHVTNTGAIDADDVVLGMLKPPGAGVDGTPLQTLFGFERVHVKAGATVEVHLGATMLDFAHVGEDGKYAETAGEYTVQFGIPETAKHGMGFATTTTVAA